MKTCLETMLKRMVALRKYCRRWWFGGNTKEISTLEAILKKSGVCRQTEDIDDLEVILRTAVVWRQC